MWVPLPRGPRGCPKEFSSSSLSAPRLWKNSLEMITTTAKVPVQIEAKPCVYCATFDEEEASKNRDYILDTKSVPCYFPFMLLLDLPTTFLTCRTTFGWNRRFNNSSLVMSLDRKSTRLNSSHQIISYAVFCLKKKKKRVFYNRK